MADLSVCFSRPWIASRLTPKVLWALSGAAQERHHGRTVSREGDGYRVAPGFTLTEMGGPSEYASTTGMLNEDGKLGLACTASRELEVTVRGSRR